MVRKVSKKRKDIKVVKVEGRTRGGGGISEWRRWREDEDTTVEREREGRERVRGGEMTNTGGLGVAP